MTGVAWTKKSGGSVGSGEGGGLLEIGALPELQATIVCVVMGLWIVVLGLQLSLSKLFPSLLWFVSCLCSWAEGQFKKK